MKKPLSLFVAALVLAGCASTPLPPDTPTQTVDGVLIGPTGRTLYTFDRDMAGTSKSTCNGGCATNWPPLMATDSAKPMGNYTLVMRDDGTKQWAYKGRPLYYWARDVKPSDRTGDGLQGGVWKVARP